MIDKEYKNPLKEKKEKQSDELNKIFIDVAVPIIVSIIGSVITSLIVLRLVL